MILNIYLGTIAAKDKMAGCGKYAKYCKAPRYKAKLTKSCPKTCKICVGGSSPAALAATAAPAAPSGDANAAPAQECKDGTPKKCPSLKRYCKLPKYKGMMKQKCSKTCGFCTVGGTEAATPAASGKQSVIELEFHLNDEFQIDKCFKVLHCDMSHCNESFQQWSRC